MVHSKLSLPALLVAGMVASVLPALAQAVEDPDLAACKATGLLALKERSPGVQDITFDMDTLSISKANTKVEDTPIRTIVMGEVLLERKGTGNNQRFLCLIGEKGKVKGELHRAKRWFP